MSVRLIPFEKNIMAKSVRVFAVGVCSAVTLFNVPTARADETMRCDHYVIGQGMSSYEVMSKCGQPAFQQTIHELVTVIVNKQSRVQVAGTEKIPGAQALDVSSQEQQPIYRDVDRWTYDFGDGSLLREVDFYNGEVIRIQTAGRPR